MTPPRPTFSSMKITFTPGSEIFDRISRVPSVDPSSHASTSTVSPVLTATTCVQQPLDRGSFVENGNQDAQAGRGPHALPLTIALGSPAAARIYGEKLSSGMARVTIN